MQEWNLFCVTGRPDDIGYRLGELARPGMAAYMQQSAAWQRVSRWRGHPFVAALRRAAETHFPALVAELEGMAAGLAWPLEDVFLWNCRGELIHNAPDGCTTLAAVSDNARFIAHNEDGDPYLRERCFLVDVQPTGKPGFVSFYYPGSLPGHTFAVNRAGLVQAINSLRIQTPAVGVPRMILARAVLDTSSLDEAATLLSDAPRASGFHHTLGCVCDTRLLSIEASVQRCSVVADAPRFGHANHMIHEGCDGEMQIVTDSSRDRQARVDALLPALRTPVADDGLLRVLRDRAPTGLPIYRDDPRDPDDENTLATALFRIETDGVAMQIYRQGHCAFDTFISLAARSNAAF
jgi:hypothetical protein